MGRDREQWGAIGSGGEGSGEVGRKRWEGTGGGRDGQAAVKRDR